MPGRTLLRDVWRRSGAALRNKKGKGGTGGGGAAPSSIDLAALPQEALLLQPAAAPL